MCLTDREQCTNHLQRHPHAHAQCGGAHAAQRGQAIASTGETDEPVYNKCTVSPYKHSIYLYIWVLSRHPSPSDTPCVWSVYSFREGCLELLARSLARSHCRLGLAGRFGFRPPPANVQYHHTNTVHVLYIWRCAKHTNMPGCP